MSEVNLITLLNNIEKLELMMSSVRGSKQYYVLMDTVYLYLSERTSYEIDQLTMRVRHRVIDIMVGLLIKYMNKDEWGSVKHGPNVSDEKSIESIVRMGKCRNTTLQLYDKYISAKDTLKLINVR